MLFTLHGIECNISHIIINVIVSGHKGSNPMHCYYILPLCDDFVRTYCGLYVYSCSTYKCITLYVILYLWHNCKTHNMHASVIVIVYLSVWHLRVYTEARTWLEVFIHCLYCRSLRKNL